jgi:hypothetical protein
MPTLANGTAGKFAIDTEQPAGPRDGMAELITPDVVLPAQLVQGARRDSSISGEMALMLAVLEDAIRCFQEHLRNPRSNPRLLAEEAEAWFRDDDPDWPFSFVNICETLGFDAVKLRRALLEWKAKRVAGGEHRERMTAEKKVYRLHLRTKRMAGIG